MINPTGEIYLIAALFLTVTIAAVIDFRIQKIPNALTFPAMVIALGYYTGVYGWQGFFFSLKGIGIGIALLILPWLLGGMGAGDAKLLGAVGAFIGARATVVAFLYIGIIGCIYAVILVACNRQLFKGYFKQLAVTFHLLWVFRKFIPDPESEQRRRPRVYYGIPIALGTICYVVLELTGHQLIG
ncbi:MAG: A24 family peptidase [Desulfobacterales bacterium]|nr:A24 family peptidase [Desulfobacterales bacterium]